MKKNALFRVSLIASSLAVVLGGGIHRVAAQQIQIDANNSPANYNGDHSADQFNVINAGNLTLGDSSSADAITSNNGTVTVNGASQPGEPACF
jgi:hypothetical protein